MNNNNRFAQEVLATVDALRHVSGQLRLLTHAGDPSIQAVEPETCTIIVLAAGLADTLERIGRHLDSAKDGH